MTQHIGTGAEETRKLRGLKIRELRVARGLRKSELAAKCGCSYSHIDNIENARKNPSLQLLQQFARELDVPIAELALGDTTLQDSA